MHRRDAGPEDVRDADVAARLLQVHMRVDVAEATCFQKSPAPLDLREMVLDMDRLLKNQKAIKNTTFDNDGLGLGADDGRRRKGQRPHDRQQQGKRAMCWTCAAFSNYAVTMHRYHTKTCKSLFRLQGGECETCHGPHHTDACAEVTQGSGGRRSPKEKKKEDERDASKDGAVTGYPHPG